ncbi:MAG: hypothetical protein J3K34DRAFT_168997 [Monoraphidium minutum]|nr:MAG: hypothetical protein J3K34DRAFT_168997 [Monoraphidium minutum]
MVPWVTLCGLPAAGKLLSLVVAARPGAACTFAAVLPRAGAACKWPDSQPPPPRHNTPTQTHTPFPPCLVTTCTGRTLRGADSAAGLIPVARGSVPVKNGENNRGGQQGALLPAPGGLAAPAQSLFGPVAGRAAPAQGRMAPMPMGSFPQVTGDYEEQQQGGYFGGAQQQGGDDYAEGGDDAQGEYDQGGEDEQGGDYDQGGDVVHDFDSDMVQGGGDEQQGDYDQGGDEDGQEYYDGDMVQGFAPGMEALFGGEGAGAGGRGDGSLGALLGAFGK